MENKKPLEVVVTSGGTVSRVDDVRHIGNFSTGETGAKIAEEFLKRGAKVHYVYGHQARRPFRRSMDLDPEKELDGELERLRMVHKEFGEYGANLSEYSAAAFEDYHYTLQDLMTRDIDVVVLAAAVGDYSADKQDGKLSSDLDEMNVKLKRNAKVISEVKKWRPEVFQVGFKLLADVSKEKLVQKSYNHGYKNGSDMTVANTMPSLGKESMTLILHKDKDSTRATEVTRDELAGKLVDLVYDGLEVKENVVA